VQPRGTSLTNDGSEKGPKKRAGGLSLQGIRKARFALFRLSTAKLGRRSDEGSGLPPSQSAVIQGPRPTWAARFPNEEEEKVPGTFFNRGCLPYPLAEPSRPRWQGSRPSVLSPALDLP
jgi:hypothetical protein